MHCVSTIPAPRRHPLKTLMLAVFAFFAIAATPAFAATGTMDIGGTTVNDLTQDASGTGWTWTAATETLTLDNTYTGEAIAVNCASTDVVNLT
jgi:hypothetical protein